MGPRIVLDTNVLVSALGWSGAPRESLKLCTQQRARLCLSPEILRELERVLFYPKLGFQERAIVEYLELLTEIAYLVEPSFRLANVLEDPDDHRVLECALASRADFVVSGDRHLTRLKSFEGIPILKPQQFLTQLAE